MPKVRELVSRFTQLVPPEMKMDFDNVGLLVGTNETPVTKALVALDITDEVIDEAIAAGAQIIFSHHPLYFELKQVSDDSLIGAKIVKLLQNNISAFCQHTNLDSVPGGVNDALAQKLGVALEGWLEGPAFLPDGREYGMRPSLNIFSTYSSVRFKTVRRSSGWTTFSAKFRSDSRTVLPDFKMAKSSSAR